MRRVWVTNEYNSSLKPVLLETLRRKRREITENGKKKRADSEIGVTILANPRNAKGFVSMENTSQEGK